MQRVLIVTHGSAHRQSFVKIENTDGHGYIK